MTPETLTKIITKQKEVIDFYADMQNWFTKNYLGDRREIRADDCDYIKGEVCGGKRARDCRVEIERIVG